MNQCRHITKFLRRGNHLVRILGWRGGNIVPIRRVNTKVEHPVVIEEGYVKKFMKAVGWMDQTRTRLKLSGYFLYESIPNSVVYPDWFRQCELPDTFASWFLVTELHVWLLMVRCMAEDAGKVTPEKKPIKGDGHLIRNCVIEALWADVGNRVKLLEGASPSLAKKQVNELSEQFQAAIISYDEGLQDDRTLAAAVWRRFYALSHDVDVSNIENIVRFIRQQAVELEKVQSEKLKLNTNVNWLSIVDKKQIYK